MRHLMLAIGTVFTFAACDANTTGFEDDCDMACMDAYDEAVDNCDADQDCIDAADAALTACEDGCDVL